MFIEPNIRHKKKGWIEVMCGSMFSGKTEELIRRLKRAQIANLRVEIFKPALDTRYDKEDIVTHDGISIKSTPVKNAKDILDLVNNIDVIGVDEAQFFDDDIVEVVNELAVKGSRVIVAGLDMDFKMKPFGPMPNLLAVADYVTKLHAICVKCGDIANYSYRHISSDETVVLGEKDVYEPRCRSCYHKG